MKALHFIDSEWHGHFGQRGSDIVVHVKNVVHSVQQMKFGPCCGPGGGGTDSLSLGTNCETTAPPFWLLTTPVLQPPNLQPALFMEAKGQPLEINIE